MDKPTLEQLEKELRRSARQARSRKIFRIIFFSVISIIAALVLIISLWLPVLQIYGPSMESTLQADDILVCLKTEDYQSGDAIAFYHNNKILVRRIVAESGNWVFIDDAGNVHIDGHPLEEPYLTEKAFGQCDLELPYQVPDSSYFVMGDNRAVSVDSRSTIIGSIPQDQVVGKIIFRIWPFESFGSVK